MTSMRDQLLRNLKDKRYRDLFVAEQIFSGLPLKIRSLREARGLTQKALGERMSKAQAWISRLEDPNYGKLTLTTLLELASAFDVALEVDFVPFSKVLDRAVSLTPEWFRVPSFEKDDGLRSEVAAETVVASTATGLEKVVKMPSSGAPPAYVAAMSDVPRHGPRKEYTSAYGHPGPDIEIPVAATATGQYEGVREWTTANR